MDEVTSNRTVDRVLVHWRRAAPFLADLAVMGVSALVAFVAAVADAWSTGLPPFVVVAAGVAGTVLLAGRRRWPVVVTVVGLAVYCATHNPVAMLAGLYSVAAHRRDRVLVATTVFVTVGFVVFDVVTGTSSIMTSTVGGIGVMAPFVAVGAYVGQRREVMAGLRDRAERAEAERELRAEQARAAERARIAREMHDVLAHKVSLIALHAGALEVNSSAGAGHVEESAALIRATARQTLEELREVLGVLRADAVADGSDLAPTARAADVGRLIEDSRRAGAAVRLLGEVPDLPDSTARAVHRIVQEALTNVNKHARGASTTVEVGGDTTEGVAVAVVNARPVAADLLDPLPGSGSGLPGLAERVRLAGGTFRSGPEPDGGWAVRAWLPWPTPGAVGGATPDVAEVVR